MVRRGFLSTFVLIILVHLLGAELYAQVIPISEFNRVFFFQTEKFGKTYYHCYNEISPNIFVTTGRRPIDTATLAKTVRPRSLRSKIKSSKKALRFNALSGGSRSRRVLRKKIRRLKEILVALQVCTQGDEDDEEEILPTPTPTPDVTPTPTPEPSPTPTPTPPPEDKEYTTTLTQNGVTFEFSEPVEFGIFANGDYWIVGPVDITEMVPPMEDGRNGWEINPSQTSTQPYDSRAKRYDETLAPSLPATISPGDTIIKTVSLDPLNDTCRPCVERAMVLTVLDAAPPENGVNSFRPGYFGSNKTMLSVKDIDLTVIPIVDAVPSAPDLATIEGRYRWVQLDHQNDWVSRFIHPSEHMPNYGASIANDSGDAVMRFMLPGTDKEKLPALINFLQFGIDLYSMALGGQYWPPNGGHSSGRKLPIAFAGMVLHHQGMKDTASETSDSRFAENGHLYESSVTGEVLFGQECTESQYWNSYGYDNGIRDCRDPYELIDGGMTPGWTYQFCCNSATWRGTLVPLVLWPELEAVWNDDEFIRYGVRWVNDGSEADNDTCAPARGACEGGEHDGESCTRANEDTVCGTSSQCTGDPESYQVTWGPDPSNPGRCIEDTDPTDGIGRYPQIHHQNANDGYYSSKFAGDMIAKYISVD